jgi:hypothetical protein
MSIETTLNQNAQDNFKKAIGYASLVQSPPIEKLVVMNWKAVLATVKDTKGTVWTSSFDEPFLMNTGIGIIDASFESNRGMALVKITSLTGTWKERLDYVIRQKSLTDMGLINEQIKSNVSDIYFIPKNTNSITNSSFLYGNFYVVISHWEQDDIGALAQQLWEILNSHNQSTNFMGNQTTINASINKEKIHVKDSFIIELKSNNDNYEWLFELDEKSLPDNIEYTERESNKFGFNAKGTGIVKIFFKAMNTTTFLIQEKTLDIVIE